MVKDDASNVDDLIGLVFQEEPRLEQEHSRWIILPSPAPNASVPIVLNVHRTPSHHHTSGLTFASINSPRACSTDPRRR